jgi:HEAT repeat protein
MIRKILHAVAFLCVPVAILITAAIRRDPMYQGEPATVWAEKIRTDRDTALNALQHLGKGALPALREMLNGPSRTESCRAAWAMGRLEPFVARETVPDLIQTLGTGNIVLQSEVMNSLSRIGITNEDIVPGLMAQLTDNYICAFAATLLNSIERDRKAENLPPLPEAGYDYGMACLKSPTPFIRINGAIQLASVAQKDERAKAALESLLNDKDMVVRVQTARLMTNPDALPNFKMVSDR